MSLIDRRDFLSGLGKGGALLAAGSCTTWRTRTHVLNQGGRGVRSPLDQLGTSGRGVEVRQAGSLTATDGVIQIGLFLTLSVPGRGQVVHPQCFPWH